MLTLYILYLFYVAESTLYQESIDKTSLTISATSESSVITREGVLENSVSNSLIYVIVKEGITEIQISAFEGYSKIISFQLPSGLKYLRQKCFKDCTSLKSITFQYGLIEIEREVFFGCSSIQNITFPSTLEKVGSPNTFYRCLSLMRLEISSYNPKFSTDDLGRILIYQGTDAICGTAVFPTLKIPDNVKTLKWCFLDVRPKVTQIDFGSASNLTTIEDQALRHTGITRMEYPRGLLTVGSNILEGCNVEFIWIPNTLTQQTGIFTPVPKDFYIEPGCPCLKMDEKGTVYNGDMTEIVLIPSNTTSIEIPTTVTDVSAIPIVESKALKDLIVKQGNSILSDYDNAVYKNQQNILIAAAGGVDKLEVAANCTKIMTFALKNLKLKYLKFRGLNLIAFDGQACHYIEVQEEVILPEGLRDISSWGFASSKIELIRFPSSLKNLAKGAFQSTTLKYADLSMCKTMTNIPETCFSGSKLVELILPQSLTSISEAAFQSCTGLKEVEITPNVNLISPKIFDSCTSLETLKFSTNLLNTIPNNAFSTCNLSKVVIPSSIETLSQDSFANNPYLLSVEFQGESNLNSVQMGVFRDCPLITSLNFGSKLEKISAGALYWMDGLININIDQNNKKFKSEDGVVYSKGLEELIAFPSGRKEYSIHPKVEAFGKSAFYRCRKLETIKQEEGTEVVISSIKEQSFLECISFVSVEIPSSVSLIEAEAFKGCTSLVNVSFVTNSKITSINPTMFSGCTSLTHVVFEEGSLLNEISANSFSGLSKLTTFISPPSLKIIGDGAFKGCSSLTNFRLANITHIGASAFKGCSKIEYLDFGMNLEALGYESFSGCTNIRSVTYCGKNIFNEDAFKTTKLHAIVQIQYGSEHFGGIPALRILDGDCMTPSFVFTSAHQTQGIPLLGPLCSPTRDD